MDRRELTIWFDDYAAGALAPELAEQVRGWVETTEEGRKAWASFQRQHSLLLAACSEVEPPAELLSGVRSALQAKAAAKPYTAPRRPLGFDQLFAWSSAAVIVIVLFGFFFTQLNHLKQLGAPSTSTGLPSLAQSGAENLGALPAGRDWLAGSEGAPGKGTTYSPAGTGGGIKASRVAIGWLGRTEGVLVRRASGKSERPEGTTTLYEGDTIIASGSRAVGIYYESGLAATVKPGSQLRLGADTISLSKGGVYCEVPSTRKGFSVTCPGDVAAIVHGTKFGVETSSAGAIVTVVEGDVEVVAAGQSVHVGANQQTAAVSERGPGAPEDVEATAELAWAVFQGRTVAKTFQAEELFVAGLRGQVVDEDGKAVGGAQVQALSTSGRLLGKTVTDSKGQFQFGHLPPGEVRLVASKGDKLKSVKQLAEAEEPFGEATITLYSSGTGGGAAAVAVRNSRLAGAVRDEAGEALADVTVLLIGPSGTLETTTNAQGRYGFTGLAAGEYVIKVHKFGYDTGEAYRNVMLDGHKQVSADFAIAAQDDSPGSVYGKVKGDSKAVAGALVRVLDNAGREVTTTTTDEAGAFELDGLPAGYYTVDIIAADNNVATVRSVKVRPGRATRLDIWTKPRSH